MKRGGDLLGPSTRIEALDLVGGTEGDHLAGRSPAAVDPLAQVVEVLRERHRRLEGALDDFVREVAFLDFDYDEIFVRLGEKLAEMLPLAAGKEKR